MSTSSRPRCATHGLLLDDAGECTRCVHAVTKESGKSLASRLAFVIVGGVFLLFLFRVVGFVVGMASGMHSSTPSSSQLTASGSRVVVYTTGTCPACRMAKTWMNDHSIAYDERRVDTDDNARRELASVGHSGTVPTFVVDGDEVLVGFDVQGVRLTRALDKRVAAPR